MSGRPKVAKNGTIYFKFTSRAFSTGIPTTLAGTPAVSVYEENNLTQTTTGVTLTVDYDSVTGLNDVAIDTTDAFYEAGKDYHLVITAGTVDSVSVVGEVVGEFRCVTSIVTNETINSEVDTALIDIGLDHLFVNAVVGTDVNDNTVLAYLTSSSVTADWDDFVNTTDSFQAIRDRGDAAWITGAGGGDATAANQTTIINTLTDIQGDTFNTDGDALDDIRNAIDQINSGASVSPVIIDDSRTWYARDTNAVADQVLVGQPGQSATYAADFSAWLNPGTGISSIVSVTEENAASITISNNLVNQDATQAHFDLADLLDNTTYRLEVIVLTTDGQTLALDCLLAVEETP